MREKWNVNNKNKGYLKIHVAVDVKTKEILSIKVTDDEYVHDNSKMLPGLVQIIIKSGSVTAAAIGKLFCDGAYEGNDIFRYPRRQWIYLV
ncbi:MAG TPA: transposase [Candidatus Sulfopaludibacter sp.]|nr:transposase [Candidatus Sulfopaludibacter sp.]